MRVPFGCYTDTTKKPKKLTYSTLYSLLCLSPSLWHCYQISKPAVVSFFTRVCGCHESDVVPHLSSLPSFPITHIYRRQADEIVVRLAQLGCVAQVVKTPANSANAQPQHTVAVPTPKYALLLHNVTHAHTDAFDFDAIVH